MNTRNKLPINLQFFAESGGDAQGSQAEGTQGSAETHATGIDYTKIQTMLEGTLAAKEETALKAYFKQQGLSEDEMKQAISDFKQQKAASQPDLNALQTQAAQAQQAAQKAQIENAAILAAVEIGIDSKTIPYILKMADLGQAMGQDGKVNEETLKTALNKVLEDIPALKPQPTGSTGFIQVGASSNSQTSTQDAELDKIFGIKK